MDIKDNLNFYKISLFVILCLPIVSLPPYFFQPDWAKGIIFRSIMAILFFLFLFKENLSIKILFEKLKKNPVFWGLISLFTTFLLASIFSVDQSFSFWGSPYRGGGFMTFAFLFVFAIFAFLKLKEKDWKNAFILSIFIGIIVSLIAIVIFYKNSTIVLRPVSTIGNPITLGIYLSILFFIALSFFIVEKKIKWKVFFAIAFFIFSNAIFITSSRATFLGIISGIILFFLLYPKKNTKIKIGLITFLIICFGFIAYLNFANSFPKYLEENKVFVNITHRLSFESIFGDERFRAWKIFSLALLDKPILGWGPENQNIGFDKFYNPKVMWSSWWDKSHNVFLDMGVQAGILGLLSYLFLIFALFWSLYKTKKNSQNYYEKIIITGIQSALLGYFVANFFSLDSMPSYILFFFIIGYVLRLSLPNFLEENVFIKNKKSTLKKVAMFFGFLILILFLWQYNYFSFVENGKVNIAKTLSENKKCDEAFKIMDNVLTKSSFLDAHNAIQYIDMTATCNIFFPEKNDEYIKNGFEVVKKAVEKRPLYTRFWLSLGSYSNSLAEKETDEFKKSDLLKQAENYFNKAEKLSPNRQEIFMGKIRKEFILKNYFKMSDIGEECLLISSEFSYCQFYLGIAKIYLGNSEDGKKEIQIAEQEGYPVNVFTLNMKADAFESVKDYKNLVEIYKEYIKLDYNNPQYHSSLAFVYSLIGEYKKAREEAVIVLKLAPDSKENVNSFLNTLPY